MVPRSTLGSAISKTEREIERSADGRGRPAVLTNRQVPACLHAVKGSTKGTNVDRCDTLRCTDTCSALGGTTIDYRLSTTKKAYRRNRKCVDLDLTSGQAFGLGQAHQELGRALGRRGGGVHHRGHPPAPGPGRVLADDPEGAAEAGQGALGESRGGGGGSAHHLSVRFGRRYVRGGHVGSAWPVTKLRGVSRCFGRVLRVTLTLQETGGRVSEMAFQGLTSELGYFDKRKTQEGTTFRRSCSSSSRACGSPRSRRRTARHA